MSQKKREYMDEEQFNDEHMRFRASLASMLYHERRANQIPLKQVADAAHISEITLRRVEAGTTDISVFEFYKVCRELGYSPSNALNDASSPITVTKKRAYIDQVRDLAMSVDPDDMEGLLTAIRIFKLGSGSKKRG